MIRRAMIFGMLGTLAACAATGPTQGNRSDVAALARTLRTMSPDVDPAEAIRAAELSYRHTHALALAYDITDPPLIHNAKVNAGRKQRGLCYHWAEDMERLLKREQFETLEIQRAIANADSRILIDHSSAVITARGADMYSGVIIDPWRQGGTLFWSPVMQDTRYPWKPRMEVLRARGRGLHHGTP